MVRRASRLTKARVLAIAVAAATLTTALAACGSSASGDTADPGQAARAKAALAGDIAPGAPKPPASLVSAANKEGKLTIYTSIATAGLTTGIQHAFNKDYPSISVRFVSGGSTQITGRYTTEAQSGAVQADDVLTGYSGFFPSALSAGYLAPIASVIPDFAKIYPANGMLDDGKTGLVFEIPNGLAYNTDLVQGGNIPKAFSDYAKPYWKNHLLGFDPKASPAFLQFWDMVLKTYGPDVVREIGQNIIPNSKGETLPPAAQSLAAGEGYADLLIPETTTQPLVATGAPIKFVRPTVATGPQYALGVSAKSPDPAAAKLFAYWAFSQNGQAQLTAVNSSTGLLNRNNGGFYTPNNNISAAEQSQILSLLGDN
jgi:iron(III) transport system substrate-binding protein